MNTYRLLRPFVFQLEAETAHQLAIRAGELASSATRLCSWVYEAPGVVPTINRGLADLLTAHGFRHVGEAVGTATHYAGDVGWMRDRMTARNPR